MRLIENRLVRVRTMVWDDRLPFGCPNNFSDPWDNKRDLRSSAFAEAASATELNLA
jgi:hypothetical protein